MSASRSESPAGLFRQICSTRYGTFFGEVIEISTQGEWGTIVITDDQGKVLDTYVGTVATFLASGEWQLVEV